MDKQHLVERLQQEMGNTPNRNFIDPDGHYIDTRIAFEFWTDDEKEEIRKRFGPQEEAVEKEKQKIADENRKRQQFQNLIDNRDVIRARHKENKVNIRSGEQFWIRNTGKDD